ncbi:MAG: nucleotidyltransferase domain-containing protein [Paraprevotella sp.]|nr:nucleotidyltransferase domain-containing protein [Paraprevotella sp.]
MWGLSEKSIEEIHGILASIPAIEEAVIYGSRARGDYKPASDIDLTLTGRDLTLRDVALLDDKLYYSYQPYYFDTSILAEIKNQDLLDNIRRDGQVFYRRQKK